MTKRRMPARLEATGPVLLATLLGVSLGGGPASAVPAFDPCPEQMRPCYHVPSDVLSWELPPDLVRVPVSLSEVVSFDVSFRAVTVDGTAVAWEDYAPLDRRFTIPAGEQSVSVPLQIHADGRPEHTEQFRLFISSPSAGTIVDGRATVTIMDGHRPRSG